MGTIICTQPLAEGKVKYTLLLDTREAAALQGNLKDVHLFSTENIHARAELLETGIQKSIKYFTVPKKFRQRKPGRHSSVQMQTPINCQRIDLPTAICFVYIIPSEQ